MNSQPSAAIEKGLTAQLMNSVTPIPRQCRRTSAMAAKSTLTSIGTIISQISAATGRFTCAHFRRADGMERLREQVPQPDAHDDAGGDPKGQVTLKKGHPAVSRSPARPIARRLPPAAE